MIKAYKAQISVVLIFIIVTTGPLLERYFGISEIANLATALIAFYFACALFMIVFVTVATDGMLETTSRPKGSFPVNLSRFFRATCLLSLVICSWYWSVALILFSYALLYLASVRVKQVDESVAYEINEQMGAES